MEKKDKKKKKKFKIFMFLYIFLWIAGTAIAGRYLWTYAESYQVDYDKAKMLSIPEYYINDLLDRTNIDLILSWVEKDNSLSEYAGNDEYRKYYEEKIGKNTFLYVPSETEKNTYLLNVGDETIARVLIGSDNEYDEYGFHGWEIKDVDIMSYIDININKTIVADEDYKVYINGMELKESAIIKSRETDMAKLVAEITGETYKTNIYYVNGFLVEPEIKAVDKDGNDIENTSVESDMVEYIKRTDYAFGESVSGRVSDVFAVYFKHMNKLATFSEISKYLVSGGEAYSAINNAQRSLEWVVKAREVSVTGQKIDNFVKYNEEYFSCDVDMNIFKNYGYRSADEEYRANVLFKNVNGEWYLDRFILK